MAHINTPPGGSSARRIKLDRDIAAYVNLDTDRVLVTENELPMAVEQPTEDSSDESTPVVDPVPPALGVPSFVLDINGNVAITPTFIAKNGTVYVDVEFEVNEVTDGAVYEVRFA
jgi:hypothetical protein